MHVFDTNYTFHTSLGVENCHNDFHFVIGHHMRPCKFAWCYELQREFGNIGSGGDEPMKTKC